MPANNNGMDLAILTRLLTERHTYLWAGVLTALLFVVLQMNGYADGLEKGVVTGVIATGVFAGCLLACTGAVWVVDRAQKGRKSRAAEEAADAAALKVFEDLFYQHRLALEYIATEVGKPTFRAGYEPDLIAMVDLHLLEVTGPQASGVAYYKVRDVIWKKMVEQGWLNGKRWPEEEMPPWDEDHRI